MKAAISSAGPGLDSGVDPRFGRCACLILYDLESGEWEAVTNPNRDAGGGAVIRTAQLVIDRGAGAVVTGNIGPNAMQVLSGQVKVHTGFQGTVSEAVQALKEGRLSEAASATVRDHAGMGGGRGPLQRGGGGLAAPRHAPGGQRSPGGRGILEIHCRGRKGARWEGGTRHVQATGMTGVIIIETLLLMGGRAPWAGSARSGGLRGGKARMTKGAPCPIKYLTS